MTRLVRRLLSGANGLWDRARQERDLDAELRAFLDASIQRKLEAGVGRRQAVREAHAELGGVEAVKDDVRDVGWDARLLSVGQDLRYGCRMLAKTPALTLVAIASLALGIGATAVMVSWVESLLLKPLSVVREQRDLRALHVTSASRDALSLSYPGFLDVRAAREPGVFDLAAFSMTAMSLRTDAEAERVWGQLFSGNGFDVLKITAAHGRVLVESDDGTPDGSPVVVLSHAFWQRRFAGRTDIVGRPVTLNGRPFTVVGVAESGFRGAQGVVAADVFVPLTMAASFYADRRLTDRGHGWLTGLLRVTGAADDSTVQSRLEVIAARLAADHPVEHGHRGLRAFPLWQSPAGGQQLLRPVFAVLAGIVGVVLLLTSANVAGLLLVRTMGRRRELAVRQAIGASRVRVGRQLLTEAWLLTGLGGLAGILVSQWSGRILIAFAPPTPVPVQIEAGLSSVVVLVGLGLTAFVGLVIGLVPIVHTGRRAIVGMLRDDTPTTTAGATGRTRQTLVVAQVALALVLLVAAGLFVRTMQHARDLDPGFAAREGLIGAVDLLPAGYDAVRGPAVMARLVREVAGLPGVESAAVARRAPLTAADSSDRRVAIDGYVPAAGEDMSIYYNQVGPGFFATVQLPLIEGRDFDQRDTASAPQVVVVSEAMARRFWPGRSALGGRVRLGEAWAEVIGVARDTKYSSLTEPLRPFMYLPLSQFYRPDVRLIVRTGADPRASVEPIRQAVRRIDPNLPLFDVATLAEHMAFSLFLMELLATLLAIFGVTALVLAAIGLYGVMALSVSQRTHEIGVRVSLGATARDVACLVAGQGFRLVSLGLAIGLLLAGGAARLLESQLVGVSPNDVVSFAGTVALLVTTAAVACLIPTRRALRVDPLVALRME